MIQSRLSVDEARIIWGQIDIYWPWNGMTLAFKQSGYHSLSVCMVTHMHKRNKMLFSNVCSFPHKGCEVLYVIKVSIEKATLLI